MATQARIGFEQLRRVPLVLFVLLYTVVTGGPFLWVATMSLRTTAEIFKAPYGLPSPVHWEKFVDAWTKSNYGTYFWNSTFVVVIAVALVTVIGAMAAHCLARYNFRGGRLVRFLILSGLVLPPQLLILALFQILLDLFDAARMDGYSDFEIFWRVTMPIGAPAVFTAVTLNFIILWNEFLFAVVLLTDDEKRTLPLGIMHFTGSHQLDVGMAATGLMIAILPIILIYAFFSETMIKGMTAGAVR